MEITSIFETLYLFETLQGHTNEKPKAKSITC